MVDIANAPVNGISSGTHLNWKRAQVIILLIAMSM
jgi:hypothetical protein